MTEPEAMNDNVAPEMLNVQKINFLFTRSPYQLQRWYVSIVLASSFYCPRWPKKSKSVIWQVHFNATLLHLCPVSYQWTISAAVMCEIHSTMRQSSGKIPWEALIWLWEEYCLFIQIYPSHLQDKDNLHFFVSALVSPVMDAETHRMRY